MESTVSEVAAFEHLCPDCSRCLDGDERQCPECRCSAPEVGWPRLESSSHPYLGHVIDGRYRLERHLGGGAAGQVYRARDLELDRPFALKILDMPHAPDSRKFQRIRGRFENEVEALSRIRNPHVVNIHEAMTLEGGVPAMLMEYVEGPTLAEVMATVDNLDLEQILVLAHQISNGLHEAHQRGVVHRDVKPANVIVERLPASGLFTRLLDFGLVHLVGEGDGERGFRGTPLYAAPEQCEGEVSITREADIYSLGCVLFHLVAGRPPFTGSDARSVIFAHVDREAPSLAEVANRDVPRALDQLVERMLAKEIDDRPGDLSLVVGTLENLMRSSENWQSIAIAETGDGLGPTTSQVVHTESFNSANLPDNQFDTHSTTTPKITQLIRFIDLDDVFPAFEAPVAACAVDIAGDCIAIADSGGRLFASNLRGRQFSASYPTLGRQIVSVAVNSRTGRIVGGTQGGQFLRWHIAGADRKPVEFCDRGLPVYAVAIGGDRQRFYWADRENVLWSYDERLDREEQICELSGAVSHLQVGPGESTALAATLDGELVVVEDLRGEARVRSAFHVGREPGALGFDAYSGAVLLATDVGKLYSYRLDGEGGLDVNDCSVTNLRGLTITRGAQIFGLSVRRATAQTWRIRYERLEDLFDWLGDREDVGQSDALRTDRKIGEDASESGS